jgi:hypothetical protein
MLTVKHWTGYFCCVLTVVLVIVTTGVTDTSASHLLRPLSDISPMDVPFNCTVPRGSYEIPAFCNYMPVVWQNVYTAKPLQGEPDDTFAQAQGPMLHGLMYSEKLPCGDIDNWFSEMGRGDFYVEVAFEPYPVLIDVDLYDEYKTWLGYTVTHPLKKRKVGHEVSCYSAPCRFYVEVEALNTGECDSSPYKFRVYVTPELKGAARAVLERRIAEIQ